jgi:RNA polymerase primary sigma factor
VTDFSREQSLANYFKDIGEVRLLSPEEEVDLAKRIKQNDHKALQILVSANLRFVVSVAKSYQNKGLSLEDLINEGNLGLMKAASRFDETRGFKFISYAVWWIRQSILQAIAEKPRMIRLPLNRVSILTQIDKVYRKLEQEYERSPTNEELANVLEMESDDVSYTIKNASRVLSIDSSNFVDPKSHLLDMIENTTEPKPDSELMIQSLTEEISSLLDTLTRREAKIIKLYFGLDGEPAHTLEEIGAIFKLTRERIRQIKEKAINKLCHRSRSKVLRQYLG